jgi:SAM-dependent methyltransferase
MKIPTANISPYPEEIEQWWWNQSIDKWPDIGEAKILRFLQEEIVTQSDRFNKERHFTPKSYGSRDLSILAYGNFYFPRTWTHLSYVLAEALDLREWTPPRKGPLTILDLGCGSGATSLSALRTLRDRGIENPIELRAIDYSGKSLDYFRNLHSGLYQLWPGSKIETKRTDLCSDIPNRHGAKYDLILLGSTLNEIIPEDEPEIYARKLGDVASLLKPSGFLVVMEPALKEGCRRLQKAAAMLAEVRRIHLHAPYFNGKGCPLVNADSPFHSHEVRSWKVPQVAKKINEPLGLNLVDLKFGFVLLSKKPPRQFDATHAIFRLVSPVNKRRGLYFFVGIAAEGSERTYEIQTRDLESGDREFVESLQRGDILELKEHLPLGDGKRIRVPNTRAIETLFAPR